MIAATPSPANASLFGTYDLRDAVNDARAVLADAISAYDPSHVFALFSSGNDSHCSTAISAEHPRFSGAVIIDTQTGVPDSMEHARESCRRQGWPLIEYAPPIPSWAAATARTAYEAIVLRYGFPGPAQHGTIYNLLKERCVKSLVRDHKVGPKGRILLVTGARLAESRTRMGRVVAHYKQPGRSYCWTAPILHWQGWHKTQFMGDRGLAPNPVTERLGISGECCCGCFACPGEFQRIQLNYPRHAEQIERWEAMARDAGTPAAWGEAPPAKSVPDPAQPNLFGGLCWSCSAKYQNRNEVARAI